MLNAAPVISPTQGYEGGPLRHEASDFIPANRIAFVPDPLDDALHVVFQEMLRVGSYSRGGEALVLGLSFIDNDVVLFVFGEDDCRTRSICARRYLMALGSTRPTRGFNLLDTHCRRFQHISDSIASQLLNSKVSTLSSLLRKIARYLTTGWLRVNSCRR